MPALLTHYLCGDKMFKSIDICKITAVISKYRNVFNLGTQGPDTFFYHNAYPWVNGESLSIVGGRLHNEKVKDFFKFALEFIKKAHGNAEEILLSYLYGYVCHYSLDIHTHPYIFYKTGFVLDDKGDKKKYDSYHRRFEAEIDMLIAKEILNKMPKEIQSYRFITIGREEAIGIADMYNHILKNIFNIDIPIKEIQRAAKHIVNITKALQDPLGIKKPVIAFIEKHMHRCPLISNMMYPLKVAQGFDHLNLAHSVWYYPWDKSFPNNTSFIELFKDAVEEAQSMCKSINEYIKGDINIQKTLDVLGNRSFSSGLDCDKNTKFKYYDLIY